MNKKPGTPIKLTTIDYVFEVIAGIGIIFLIVLPFLYYSDLPAQIPKHYNALGEVDAYGNRGAIWMLPTVGLLFYVALTILNKFPFLFNYPVEVTGENAERLYKLGTRTIRITKIILVISFAFLNFKTITIALNRANNIGKFYLPLFATVLIIFSGTVFFKMIKK